MNMTGEQLKRQGQLLADIKTGIDWRVQALETLREWIHTFELRQITIESFRTWVELNKLPQPASVNSWGKFGDYAKAAGIIKPTNVTVKAMRPRARSRRVLLWEVV